MKNRSVTRLNRIGGRRYEGRIRRVMFRREVKLQKTLEEIKDVLNKIHSK